MFTLVRENFSDRRFFYILLTFLFLRNRLKANNETNTGRRLKITMKKINSIDYGGKVIGIGLVFLIVIPVLLYILNLYLNSYVIQVVLFVSMGIGFIMEAGYSCLLTIELRQDRLINEYYKENPTSTKTPQQILDETKR